MHQATTDYCWWNPNNNAQSNSPEQKGKGKGKAKGKSKGKGKGKGSGGKGKAKGGRGNGNFPASYTPTTAYYTEDQQEWQNWNAEADVKDESGSPNWAD